MSWKYLIFKQNDKQFPVVIPATTSHSLIANALSSDDIILVSAGECSHFCENRIGINGAQIKETGWRCWGYSPSTGFSSRADDHDVLNTYLKRS